jgi:hypothetical protein
MSRERNLDGAGHIAQGPVHDHNECLLLEEPITVLGPKKDHNWFRWSLHRKSGHYMRIRDRLLEQICIFGGGQNVIKSPFSFPY